jgi:putative flippase GtrA
MDNVLDPSAKKRALRRGMHVARFVGAGVANTLITIACYQALLFFMGHLPAYVLSYAVGVAIAYYLYTRHVFGARTSTRSFVLFAVFYVIAGLIGSLINAGLIDLLGWSARLAIFATVLAMLPVNYLGSRWCLLETPSIDGGRT